MNTCDATRDSAVSRSPRRTNTQISGVITSQLPPTHTHIIGRPTISSVDSVIPHSTGVASSISHAASATTSTIAPNSSDPIAPATAAESASGHPRPELPGRRTGHNSTACMSVTTPSAIAITNQYSGSISSRIHSPPTSLDIPTKNTSGDITVTASACTIQNPPTNAHRGITPLAPCDSARSATAAPSVRSTTHPSARRTRVMPRFLPSCLTPRELRPLAPPALRRARR